MSSKPSPVGREHEIEQRLLELAYTTDVTITAPALAYFAPCSIEEAAQALERLAAADHLRMEVGDDGRVTYEMPGREKLAAGASLGATPSAGRAAGQPPRGMPLRREVPRHELPRRAIGAPAFHAASPLLAALLTVGLPGAGHLYAGRVVAGVLWFLAITAGYALILPGLILHLFGIASAANAARQLNYRAQLLLPARAPAYDLA